MELKFVPFSSCGMATQTTRNELSEPPAATVQADDYSNHWNGFVHSYLGALIPHETNVINEDRQAAKDFDSALTVLASGVAAEQHDLTNDSLNEWQAAALLLSPLDDVVVNAWANQEAALAILHAWDNHSNTQATPVADFANQFPSESASPSIGAQIDTYFGESCLTSSPTNCVIHDSATEQFLSNFVHGAVAGDFANNTGWGGIAGQTTTGFVPVIGQVADARDTVAALGEFGNGGWQNWGTYFNLAAVAIAWVPGMDWVKGEKSCNRGDSIKLKGSDAHRQIISVWIEGRRCSSDKWSAQELVPS